MKTHFNPAKNKEVFGANAGTWRMAKSFQTTGWVVGFVSEIAVLFNSFIGLIAAIPLFWWWANYIVAFIPAAYICYKLATERINTVRQASKIIISSKEGAGRQLGTVANLAVIIAAIIVFGASGLLTVIGGISGVNNLAPDIQHINTDKQDSTLAVVQNDAIAQYISDSTAIANNYNAQINAVYNEYAGKINPWEHKRKSAKDAVNRNWAIKQMKPFIDERDSKINALVRDRAARLTDLNTQKRATIAVAQDKNAQIAQLTINQLQTKVSRTNWVIDKATIFIPIIMLCSFILLIIGTFIDEKFKTVAEIEEVVLPNKYDLLPSLTDELKETATILANSWGRSTINLIKKLKSNPTIDEYTDNLIEMKLHEYRKTVLNIGEDKEPDNKPAIGFKQGYKSAELPKQTTNNIKQNQEPKQEPEQERKPGTHLRRIFNKTGIGETFKPEPEPEPQNTSGLKEISLVFASRQLAAMKSHVKQIQEGKSTRSLENAQAQYKYWHFIVTEMQQLGVTEKFYPNFNIEEWQN